MWLPRLLVESALIVFSVLLALAVDEWRDHRASLARSREALSAITTELKSNREAVQRTSEFHAGVHAKLREFAAAGKPIDLSQLHGGVFQPATLLQSAWITARDTGALEPLPFSLVSELSKTYEYQTQYMTLSRAISDDITIDLRRRGLEPVLKEGLPGFTTLAQDFSSREQNLVKVYDAALAQIASAPH